jgi:penicillin V acylase-like amidase (Ntn superfamily)
MKKWIVALTLVSFFHTSYACTAVNIKAVDGTVIAGRTMEWAFDMKWTINSIPQGTKFRTAAPDALKLPPIQFITKYAVLGVSPGIITGSPALLEGQNSAGLAMSGNFLPGYTEYQTVTTKDLDYVSILDFGTLALGMFANIAELKKELPRYKVWYDASLPSGPTPPWLHFVFTDRTGASIIVEFVKGQMRIHDNVANVLTNAPTYDWHITNVRNFLSLSNFAPSSVIVNGQNVTELGQGGGLVGLPADYTPPSRFIRAAYLRQLSTQPSSRAEGVQLIGHILNNVDIPIGVAASKDGNKVVSDFTQWVAIKDLSNQQWHVSNYMNRTNYLTIDLKKIFDAGKPGSWLIDQLPYQTIDITNKLIN